MGQVIYLDVCVGYLFSLPLKRTAGRLIARVIDIFVAESAASACRTVL
jgi:hypothetical protein